MRRRDRRQDYARDSSGAPRSGHRPRWVRWVSVTVTVTAVIGAAAMTIHRWQFPALREGSPLAATRIEAVDAPTVAVLRVPRSGWSARMIDQENAVISVVQDLQTYWETTLPTISDTPFGTLRGGVTAMDSAASSGSAPCIATPGQIVGNAYYCPQSDGIIYDASALVPVLLARYGPAGLVGAFAHEFGHAIQARIGPTIDDRSADPERFPSLLIELQADCWTGSFLAWALAGGAPHLSFGDGALVESIGPLLDFADPATTPPTEPTAHGLQVDRLRWVVHGFREGPGACQEMTLDDLHPTLGMLPADPTSPGASADGARFGADEDVQAAAARSLRDFLQSFADTSPGENAQAGADLTGSGQEFTSPDPDLLADVAPYGQFAEAAVLALAVGDEFAGAARPAERSREAACFTGAWVGSVFPSQTTGALGSWPGDVDEALTAVRLRPSTTFEDLAAFSDGFADGIGACTE